MSPWSEWTACDPCQKKQFRSRTIENFGQFNGLVCNQPLGDRRSCKTEIDCPKEETPPCSSTEFQCESGECIKKRLVCNGDNDCGDFSDEDVCDEEPRRPCGKNDLELSEMARGAGHGINMLGSDPRENAFNNEFYNGVCNYVRDPKTLEKLRYPWNIMTLTYEANVHETYSKEVYEHSSMMLKEILDDTTFSLNADFSYKFSATEQTPGKSNSTKLGLGYKYNKAIKTLTSESLSKDKSFMRVKGQIQVGTFRMRSRNPVMKDTFREDVFYLPLEYTKGEYFRFLEDYGTHYAISGKEGGEYELIYMLNKEVMKRKSLTTKDVQHCITPSVSFDSADKITDTHAELKADYCKKDHEKTGGMDDDGALIHEVVASVRGGLPEAIAALKTKIENTGVMDVDTYVKWAKTLGNAPLLIHSQPEGIENLIPLTMANAEAKKENLRRAFQEYIAEYSVCKCQPCKNGGTVMMVNGECICLCPVQFKGWACEQLKDPMLTHYERTAVQEGNWGCWTSWSSCTEGRRSRTRSCNTNGLSGGTCKGSTTDSDYC